MKYNILVSSNNLINNHKLVFNKEGIPTCTELNNHISPDTFSLKVSINLIQKDKKIFKDCLYK